MSYSWRERLQQRKQRIMQLLDLTEEDWNFIKDNIGAFCTESDDQIRLVYESLVDVDDKVDKMTDREFDEMTIEVIRAVFKKLGYKLKKKKKKNQQQDEEEQNEEPEKVPEDDEEEEEIAEEEAIPA